MIAIKKIPHAEFFRSLHAGFLCIHALYRVYKTVLSFFQHLIHEVHSCDIRYRQGKYHRPGLCLKAGMIHDRAHNLILFLLTGHDENHLFFRHQADSQEFLRFVRAVPLA